MNELAKQGASKRQMAYLGRRRTEFLKDYLNPDWSDERIEQEVSSRVIAEWLPQYDPNTEKQKPNLEQAIPPETVTTSETTNLTEGKTDKAEDQKENPSEKVSKGQNLEKPEPELNQTPPLTGFAAALMKASQNPESDEGEDEPQGTHSDDLANDGDELPDIKQHVPAS